MAAVATELAGSSVGFTIKSRIVCNSVLCSSFSPASNACFLLLQPSLGFPSFRVCSTFVVEAGGAARRANERVLGFKAAAGAARFGNGRTLGFEAASVARYANGRTLGFQNGLASRNRVLRRSVVAAVAEEGARQEIEDDDDDDEGYDPLEEDIGFRGEEKVEEEEEEMGAAPAKAKQSVVRRTFRLLGNKEKKELRAYAHQLGNDICVHQVGKWGVTANVVTAISDALEANELIKVRVLDNLADEMEDTVRELESRTEAQVVGIIGRTLLLYRPSLRKLTAAQAAQEKLQQQQRRARTGGVSAGWKKRSSQERQKGSMKKSQVANR
ncbi:hypothetical protein CY35_13G019500 [Sphagnum magellanicum]|nr:hypothetical protein CY35_13G019500 [Sphagnum magellanicum]